MITYVVQQNLRLSTWWPVSTHSGPGGFSPLLVKSLSFSLRLPRSVSVSQARFYSLFLPLPSYASKSHLAGQILGTFTFSDTPELMDIKHIVCIVCGVLRMLFRRTTISIENRILKIFQVFSVSLFTIF